MAQAERISLQCRRPVFDPWVGKIPWGREWLPIPVFLPGGFHGQRSLAVYSPRGPTSWTPLSDFTHANGVYISISDSTVDEFYFVLHFASHKNGIF